MKKSAAVFSLIFLNLAAVLLNTSIFVFLFLLPFNMFWTLLIGAALLVGHTALSVRLYKRINRRYGVSEGRYAAYAALPAAAVSVPASVVMLVFGQNQQTVPLGWIAALTMTVYSAVYFAVLRWWLF